MNTPTSRTNASDLADRIEQVRFDFTGTTQEQRALLVAALRAYDQHVYVGEGQWRPVNDGEGTSGALLYEPGEEVTFHCMLKGDFYEYTMKLPSRVATRSDDIDSGIQASRSPQPREESK